MKLKLKNDYSGWAVATGAEVAGASWLLENHPHLRAGAIAAIVTNRAADIIGRAASGISDDLCEAIDESTHVQLAQMANHHAKTLAEARAASANSANQLYAIEDILDVIKQAKIEADIKPILQQIEVYQESFKVWSEPDLLIFFLKNRHKMIRRDLAQLSLLMWYRAFFTQALGSDYCCYPTIHEKDGERLRKEYLRRLAIYTASPTPAPPPVS